jgi:hypothetical protein
VSHQTEISIRIVVDGCLARCRHSDSPLACLAETVDNLRAAGWRERDVRAVEKAVLRMVLNTFVDPQPESLATET